MQDNLTNMLPRECWSFKAITDGQVISSFIFFQLFNDPSSFVTSAQTGAASFPVTYCVLPAHPSPADVSG
jgi:hypothetical protein